MNDSTTQQQQQQQQQQLEFYRSKHIEYVLKLINKTSSNDESNKSLESCLTEHLRMSGIYWCIMTLVLLDQLHLLPCDKIIQFIQQCHNNDGGFSGNVNHDSHILYTCSALQILAIYDKLDVIDNDKTIQYILKRYNEYDGSFTGDIYGEIDTRFTYCSLLCLSILNKLHLIDKNKVLNFLQQCKNYDGGYGAIPSGESHSGQIFTVIATYGILDNIDNNNSIDKLQLTWWLCDRQLYSGGLNGRPEKLPDVCYSWWIYSTLCILQCNNYIDESKLQQYILTCQDSDTGGISDRPGDITDIFHTYFGIAALSLMNKYNLNKIDPVYALPTDTVKRLKLKSWNR